MLFFKKNLPHPECLEIEKNKANGDYKCGDVLERLKNDFQNKCYICEYKEPLNINIEHFIPHKGDKELKFDWYNLFWSCAHCNNTKLDKFDNILNCTDENENIEAKLEYIFKPFPFEKVEIGLLDNSEKSQNTKDLLLKVYNGTTKLKTLESVHLRNCLLKEIKLFQESLIDYFDSNNKENKEYFLIRITNHLNSASNFTSFKRTIIRNNPTLLAEFNLFII